MIASHVLVLVHYPPHFAVLAARTSVEDVSRTSGPAPIVVSVWTGQHGGYFGTGMALTLRRAFRLSPITAASRAGEAAASGAGAALHVSVTIDLLLRAPLDEDDDASAADGASHATERPTLGVSLGPSSSADAAAAAATDDAGADDGDSIGGGSSVLGGSAAGRGVGAFAGHASASASASAAASGRLEIGLAQVTGAILLLLPADGHRHSSQIGSLAADQVFSSPSTPAALAAAGDDTRRAVLGLTGVPAAVFPAVSLVTATASSLTHTPDPAAVAAADACASLLSQRASAADDACYFATAGYLAAVWRTVQAAAVESARLRTAARFAAPGDGAAGAAGAAQARAPAPAPALSALSLFGRRAAGLLGMRPAAAAAVADPDAAGGDPAAQVEAVEGVLPVPPLPFHKAFAGFYPPAGTAVGCAPLAADLLRAATLDGEPLGAGSAGGGVGAAADTRAAAAAPASPRGRAGITGRNAAFASADEAAEAERGGASATDGPSGARDDGFNGEDEGDGLYEDDDEAAHFYDRDDDGAGAGAGDASTFESEEAQRVRQLRARRRQRQQLRRVRALQQRAFTASVALLPPEGCEVVALGEAGSNADRESSRNAARQTGADRDKHDEDGTDDADADVLSPSARSTAAAAEARAMALGVGLDANSGSSSLVITRSKNKPGEQQAYPKLHQGHGCRYPRLVRPGRELGSWRILQVACSDTHTAAVSHAGALFTWGAGAQGELGTGSAVACPTPRLVPFFGVWHPLRVVAVAAGSGPLGGHTVVIACGFMVQEAAAAARLGLAAAPTSGAAAAAAAAAAAGQSAEDAEAEAAGLLDGSAFARRGLRVAPLGRVFAFGSGLATGTGQLAPVRTPRLVPSPDPCDMYSPFHGGLAGIAAGAGFTAALARSGAAYSWGSVREGRTGLGDDGSSSSGSTLGRRLRQLRAQIEAAVAAGALSSAGDGASQRSSASTEALVDAAVAEAAAELLSLPTSLTPATAAREATHADAAMAASYGHDPASGGAGGGSAGGSSGGLPLPRGLESVLSSAGGPRLHALLPERIVEGWELYWMRLHVQAQAQAQLASYGRRAGDERFTAASGAGAASTYAIDDEFVVKSRTADADALFSSALPRGVTLQPAPASRPSLERCFRYLAPALAAAAGSASDSVEGARAASGVRPHPLALGLLCPVFGSSEPAAAAEALQPLWASQIATVNAAGDGTTAALVASAPRVGLPDMLSLTVPVRSISAGGAGGEHAVAVDAFGHVWAWGRNAAGQVGIGSRANVTTPLPVPLPTAPSATELPGSDVAAAATVAQPLLCVAVAAGADHSVAVDTAGAVFAWGGNGGACVGGDCNAEALAHAAAVDAMTAGGGAAFAGSDAGSAEAARLPPLQSELFLSPRRLQPFGDGGAEATDAAAGSNTGLVAVAVSAGAHHTAVLTGDGHLYVAGSLDADNNSMNTSANAQAQGRRGAQQRGQAARAGGQSNRSTDAQRRLQLRLACGNQDESSGCSASEQSSSGDTPRTPAWRRTSAAGPRMRPRLLWSGTDVSAVASGGRHLFALLRERTAGGDLASAWLQACADYVNALMYQQAAQMEGRAAAPLPLPLRLRLRLGAPDVALVVTASASAASSSLLLDSQQQAQSQVQVREVLAHRAVLAASCDGLARLLREAIPPGGTSTSGFDFSLSGAGAYSSTELGSSAGGGASASGALAPLARIPLPDMGHETALCLVEWAYSGSVRELPPPHSRALSELALVAARYGARRLHALCVHALAAPAAFWLWQLAGERDHKRRKAERRRLLADADADQGDDVAGGDDNRDDAAAGTRKQQAPRKTASDAGAGDDDSDAGSRAGDYEEDDDDEAEAEGGTATSGNNDTAPPLLRASGTAAAVGRLLLAPSDADSALADAAAVTALHFSAGAAGMSAASGAGAVAEGEDGSFEMDLHLGMLRGAGDDSQRAASSAGAEDAAVDRLEGVAAPHPRRVRSSDRDDDDTGSDAGDDGEDADANGGKDAALDGDGDGDGDGEKDDGAAADAERAAAALTASAALSDPRFSLPFALLRLLQDGAFADVLLLARGGWRVRAHAFVVLARAPRLRDMMMAAAEASVTAARSAATSAAAAASDRMRSRRIAAAGGDGDADAADEFEDAASTGDGGSVSEGGGVAGGGVDLRRGGDDYDDGDGDGTSEADFDADADAEAEADADAEARMFALQLPDAPLTIVRLLYWLYAGALPPLPLLAHGASPLKPTDEDEGASLRPSPELLPLSEWIPGAPGLGSIVDAPPDSDVAAVQADEDAIAGAGAGAGGTDAADGDAAAWSPVRQLLADVAAARRYGLPDYAAALESALVECLAAESDRLRLRAPAPPRKAAGAMLSAAVTATSVDALQLLRVADAPAGQLPLLREASLQHAARHLDAVTAAPSFAAASRSSRSPQLLDALLAASWSRSRDLRWASERQARRLLLSSRAAADAAGRMRLEDGDSADMERESGSNTGAGRKPGQSASVAAAASTASSDPRALAKSVRAALSQRGSNGKSATVAQALSAIRDPYSLDALVPWWLPFALIPLVVGAGILSTVFPAAGPVIPALNVVLVLGIVLAAVRGLALD